MARFDTGGGSDTTPDDTDPEAEPPSDPRDNTVDPTEPADDPRDNTVDPRDDDDDDDRDQRDDDSGDDDGGDDELQTEREAVIEDAMTPPLSPVGGGLTRSSDPADRRVLDRADEQDRGGREAADEPAREASDAEQEADAPPVREIDTAASTGTGSGLSETTTGAPAPERSDAEQDRDTPATQEIDTVPSTGTGSGITETTTGAPAPPTAAPGRVGPTVVEAKQLVDADTAVDEADLAKMRAEERAAAAREFVPDQPTDLGDIPVQNPATGNRVEADLAQLSRGARRLSARAARSPLNILTAPSKAGAAAAGALGATDVEQTLRRGVRQTETAQTAGGAAIVGAVPDAIAAAKEVGETGVGVATGDVEPRDVAREGAGLAVSTAESAIEKPVAFGGALLGGAVTGTATLRGATSAATRVRSRRVRRGADETVGFEETTSERGQAGDLPRFETDPGAPTTQAVQEVSERARDNPQAVLDALDAEGALYQSTRADLGDEFAFERGSSELPGGFTSPDASPLRLAEGRDSSIGLRLPRPRDLLPERDRLAAFEGDRVEAMPPEATGARRRRVGPDEFEPDPQTSGAQFLDREAERGTAFVRPPGSRSTELEAIFPPGSRFQREGRLAVEMESGRAVPMDVFRRAERRGDDGDGPGGGGVRDRGPERTVAQIQRELDRRRRRQGADETGVVPTGGGTATSRRPSSTPSRTTTPDAARAVTGSGRPLTATEMATPPASIVESTPPTEVPSVTTTTTAVLPSPPGGSITDDRIVPDVTPTEGIPGSTTGEQPTPGGSTPTGGITRIPSSSTTTTPEVPGGGDLPETPRIPTSSTTTTPDTPRGGDLPETPPTSVPPLFDDQDDEKRRRRRTGSVVDRFLSPVADPESVLTDRLAVDAAGGLDADVRAALGGESDA